MAYASNVGDGIRRVVVEVASDQGWSLEASDQVMAQIEAAELAVFGEYELIESDADQAAVYQLVRDGLKRMSPAPVGLDLVIAWLDSYAKGAEYAAGAGSTASTLGDAAKGTADVVTEIPETVGKLSGGLGLLAGGVALLLFASRR